MAHRFTWDKLVKNAYRLNPKSRGPKYPYTPKFEVSSFTSGPNRGQKCIVPFVGTKSVLISLRAWGVTQASLHNITLLFSGVDIKTEDPQSTNYFQIQYDGKMYWIQKLDKFRHPLTSRCTCFTGDTKVLLADGTYKTFRELEGKDFEVKSYKNGNYINVYAGNCSKKQINVPTVKLTFSDNSIVHCTPDHKFLQDNNIWEQAQNLLNKTIKTYNKQNLICINIEDAGLQDVYCLTVPETENFILQNGLVVHNCADEFFTFAWWKSQAGCLYGPRPRPYQRKTTTYPQRNPQHLIGCCKHVYNAWEVLRNSGLTVN